MSEDKKDAQTSKTDRTPEEVRKVLVEHYKFEEDDERLDDLVERELSKNKELSTAIRQKRDWRNKAGDLEKKEKPDDKTPSAPSSEVDDILDLQADGYAPAEIKKLKEYSKKMNVSISEVKNDPYIKSGIEAERAKDEAEDATPSPSTRTFKTKAGEKSFGDLSEGERRENFDNLKGKVKKSSE